MLSLSINAQFVQITGPGGLIIYKPGIGRLRYATMGIYINAVERFPCMRTFRHLVCVHAQQFPCKMNEIT